MTGTSTTQSPANPTSESGYSENPALLNAETAWNTPLQSASSGSTSWIIQNRSVRVAATTSWTARVTSARPISTCRRSPRLSTLRSVLATSCRRRPSRLERSITSSDATVMKPSPPIWMSARMTPWPKPLQWVPVSTTASPVTHTAEVAVKNASRVEVERPDAVENGSARSAAPTVMTVTNPVTT